MAREEDRRRANERTELIEKGLVIITKLRQVIPLSRERIELRGLELDSRFDSPIVSKTKFTLDGQFYVAKDLEITLFFTGGQPSRHKLKIAELRIAQNIF